MAMIVCLQGTRYLVSNGTSYAPAPGYYAAAAGAPGPAPVYQAALATAPPPPPPPAAAAIQYSPMPTTGVDNACGPPALMLVGSGAATSAQPLDRPSDVRTQPNPVCLYNNLLQDSYFTRNVSYTYPELSH